MMQNTELVPMGMGELCVHGKSVMREIIWYSLLCSYRCLDGRRLAEPMPRVALVILVDMHRQIQEAVTGVAVGRPLLTMEGSPAKFQLKVKKTNKMEK